MNVTVYLGPKGNNFILNGKLKDLNAEVRLENPQSLEHLSYSCPRKSMVP